MSSTFVGFINIVVSYTYFLSSLNLLYRGWEAKINKAANKYNDMRHWQMLWRK